MPPDPLHPSTIRAQSHRSLVEGVSSLARRVQADRELTNLIRRKFAIKCTTGACGHQRAVAPQLRAHSNVCVWDRLPLLPAAAAKAVHECTRTLATPSPGYSLNAVVDVPADDPIEIIKHLMIGSEGTLGFVSQVGVVFQIDQSLAACLSSVASTCNLLMPRPCCTLLPRAGNVQHRP